jgi:hypothetical protein
LKSQTLTLLCTVLFTFACGDPAQTTAIDSFGPEAPGVRPGPRHRPGQPCRVCHGGSGPGSPEFSVAGTIFARVGDPAPAVGAIVTVTDTNGRVLSLTANDVGNFYAPQKSYVPVYPLRVSVTHEGKTVNMNTLMNGTGGCADCHRSNGSQGRVPAVYVQ